MRQGCLHSTLCSERQQASSVGPTALHLPLCIFSSSRSIWYGTLLLLWEREDGTVILEGGETTPEVIRGSVERCQTSYLKEHRSAAGTAAQEWEGFQQKKGKGKGNSTVQADSFKVKGQNFKLACSWIRDKPSRTSSVFWPLEITLITANSRPFLLPTH